jgi:hypothetical protein
MEAPPGDPLKDLRTLLPRLREWVSATLAEHADRAQPTATAGFGRLPRCFPGTAGEQLLAGSRFVVVDQLPKPPLGSWGLERFRAFEEMAADAITYENTYFITPQAAQNESVHLHELVHVVQWQVLGFETFALSYAVGLDLCGYVDSPLEALAWNHQVRFLEGQDYDVGMATWRQVGFMYGNKT